MDTLKKPPVVQPAKPDPRMKLIAARIRKERQRPDALIEILHTVQNAYGYLPLGVLTYVTKSLKLPPSRVYAAATFYHFFSLKPKGEHTCIVCTGTACYVKKSREILKALEKAFGIEAGQVTPDGRLGLQVARCIGACGLAPVAIVDDRVESNVEAAVLISEITGKLNQP